jgi:hypothetical protein
MASVLVYTSTVELSAAREAAHIRREEAARARAAREYAKAMERFPEVLAMVREEGDCFGVKVNSTEAKWRAVGWTAEMVARLICDPETDVEYWPVEL